MNDKINIRRMVETLGLNIRTDVSHIAIPCPVCSSAHKNKRKTMDISFDKNVFNCPRCNTGGGALNFWSLMRGISDDRKTAYTDYMQYINNSPIVHKKETSYIPVNEAQLASLDVRDKTYREFLNSLELYDKHYQELKNKRGLSDAAIKNGMYKSFPQGSSSKIVENLLNKGCVLEGVSGFYKENGIWKLIGENYYSGYIIPVINGDEKIQALQIRADKGETRYFYISSSNKEKGCKACASLHLSKGKKRKLLITEGPLKANIINHYTDWYCLALPGVNNIRLLYDVLPSIKSHGFDKVYIAFDMDLYENIHVADALNKLKDILKEFKISFATLDWDTNYKGLDDWLLAQKK